MTDLISIRKHAYCQDFAGIIRIYWCAALNARFQPVERPKPA
jgi:hypothetical protein